MQLNMKVTALDGNIQTVSTTLSTVVAWERKYKRKASQMSDGIGVEDLMFLAWEATRASGVTVPQLDEYIKLQANIEIVESNAPKALADQSATD